MRHDVFNPQDFGYFFASHSHVGLHGHSKLEVRLSDQPSYQHFDPEDIELNVIVPSASGAVPQLNEIHLNHPWTGLDRYEVSCGHVFIYDRKGKKVDAFTFGCSVKIQTDKEKTNATFESPVSIFEVTPVNPVIDLFVDEVEILLAMRRAAWLKQNPHLHAYEERLCQVKPTDLYIACLQGVEERLTRISNGSSELGLHLRTAIRAELHWLKETGIWLGDRKRLEDVI